jgi:hypothetical protein
MDEHLGLIAIDGSAARQHRSQALRLPLLLLGEIRLK